MIKKTRCFLFVLFTPVVLFAIDVGFGGKIGITDGWGYDQARYIGKLNLGFTAGIFVDFKLLDFLSLSIDEDYHAWNSGSTEMWTRYDFLSTLFRANIFLPSLKWKPVVSIGPLSDILVNAIMYDRGISGSKNLSNTNIFAYGFSVGLGVISPRFKTFDFSFQVFYNSQLSQAGDIVPQGSSLGGGFVVPRCQTFDAVLSFSFHPFRAKK